MPAFGIGAALDAGKSNRSRRCPASRRRHHLLVWRDDCRHPPLRRPRGHNDGFARRTVGTGGSRTRWKLRPASVPATSGRPPTCCIASASVRTSGAAAASRVGGKSSSSKTRPGHELVGRFRETNGITPIELKCSGLILRRPLC
jgi:hypothetical protein